MGIYYYVANTAKKEYYSPGDLASASKWGGLLYGLSGHALAVLINDADGEVEGRWAGDPLYVVGDEHTRTVLHWVEEGRLSGGRRDAAGILEEDYTDITPLLITYLSEDPEFRRQLGKTSDSRR